MGSMVGYSKAAMERAMKVQEVILRAMAKRITWWQAAEIVGISDRWMRRWRERYQEFGYDGLFDKRRGKASPRRVPMALAEQVLQFYREKYFDLNVLHFHQKLVEEHGIRLSYTWVKLALWSGTGGAGAQAGSASQAAPAPAAAGDAVAHRWQPASLVPGRALVRPAGDSRRCHQRDVLRAAGGKRIHADGDRGADAVQAFQRMLEVKGFAGIDPLMPLANVGRARAYALAGDKARSRVAY